jgi:hypothetical protein
VVEEKARELLIGNYVQNIMAQNYSWLQEE